MAFGSDKYSQKINIMKIVLDILHISTFEYFMLTFRQLRMQIFVRIAQFPNQLQYYKFYRISFCTELSVTRNLKPQHRFTQFHGRSLTPDSWAWASSLYILQTRTLASKRDLLPACQSSSRVYVQVPDTISFIKTLQNQYVKSIKDRIKF